jgi:hypothetical protein
MAAEMTGWARTGRVDELEAPVWSAAVADKGRLDKRAKTQIERTVPMEAFFPL